jgi:hypothetical protein
VNPQTDCLSVTVVFRAFNDGIGFRYDAPLQPNLTNVEIAEELTEFTFADNAHAWWIPANRVAMDFYEMLYSRSPIAMLDTVHTPLTPDQPRVRTTLAKQLALYVVLYSPVQMAADIIENYGKQPAFQFIRDVPVDWGTTRVIDGQIGDYVIVAHKQRGADSWYVGAITDEEARTFDHAIACRACGRRWTSGAHSPCDRREGVTVMP